MKSTLTDRIPLHYSLLGQGAITLVFVHGAFIDMSYWKEQADYFRTNYRVLTLDLAGHGKSGKHQTDWSVQSLGEDVASLIQKLDLTNVILIGHSLGGDVILEIAAKIPEKIMGMVGIDNFKNAGTAMPSEIQKQVDQAFLLMETNFPSVSENFVRQSLVTPLTDVSISERIISAFRNFDPQVGLAILKSSFSYHDRERELLQQLNLKLYLINVDYNPTNEQLLQQYARAGYEIVRLQQTSHYPMNENPKEFNRALEKIIAKIKKDKFKDIQ